MKLAAAVQENGTRAIFFASCGKSQFTPAITATSDITRVCAKHCPDSVVFFVEDIQWYAKFVHAGMLYRDGAWVLVVNMQVAAKLQCTTGAAWAMNVCQVGVGYDSHAGNSTGEKALSQWLPMT